MRNFCVTGDYQTESGNLGTFRFEIEAPDHETAMAAAERRDHMSPLGFYFAFARLIWRIIWE